MVIPIILSSDKTILGSLSGEASAWPLYMTVGNVVGYERFKPQNQAMHLIALSSMTGISLIDKHLLILSRDTIQ